MKKILVFFMIPVLFSSCLQMLEKDTQGELFADNWNRDSQGESGKAGREWTFIVYMAADNDLEYAAIADFNEIEAVRNLERAPVSILILLDRSSGYDMTNGNWSGTRLYEVKSDPDGLNSTIISTRLDCPQLGLSKDTDTELNTADPFVLSRLIDFAKLSYTAENYALFVWGHGTGWRGGPGTETPVMPQKAVAFDDTHGQYMSLPAFGRAIAGKGLSVIGFDTCYAALLEVAYQIRNDAGLLIGSEGAVMSTGWDYTALFTDFLGKPFRTAGDLGNSIQKQFSLQYATLGNATISQIQLSEVSALFTAFDNFAYTLANAITTR
ncbi:MAG: clostripain-related cysteine peptidase, partial [Treponema sp.]|nr:clostripain-related cysteine peptidase [Treponema sp.]